MPALRRVRMIKGPARVTVRGRCFVFGADVSNSRVDVRAGKALPFELGAGSRLFVRMGQRARIWWANPFSAGSLIWKDTFRTILSAAEKKGRLTVLIAGDSDTGKSALCTYLANMALTNSFLPCIVDGDVGQGDIAPPSAIGAAVLHKQVTDLRDSTAHLFGFVGSISPAGIENLVAETLQELSKRSRDSADLQIINTDGYAHDEGLQYKRLIADKIQPDIIVVLGRNPPLTGALRSSSWQLISARSSEQVTKSPIERKWRRHDQFLRFIGDGHVLADTDRMKFSYLGDAVSAAVLMAIPVLDYENLDLFVGLGSEGNVDGFGMIEGIVNGTMHIRTDLEIFDTIYLSNIRLTGDSAEQITLEMPGQVSQES
jgi:polynucleotide 5'-hydroxyl-kinase GRC3/NOL9